MVYVFKRHKRTGHKNIIDIMEYNQAVEFCTKENNISVDRNIYWYEFSKYKEYAEY